MTNYNEKFCGCKDASRKNSCKGLPNCCLFPEHPERLHPPTTEVGKVEPRRTPGCVWFSAGLSIGMVLAEGVLKWYA